MVKGKVDKSHKDEMVDKKNKNVKVDEPLWYHYVIVLIFFGAFFFGIYSLIVHFEDDVSVDVNVSQGLVLHKYPYVVGNITYNIDFHSSVDEIENFDFVVEPDKLDVLNTRRFVLAFMEYNGTDNGDVTKSSTMLLSFLRTVYLFRFDKDSFSQINVSNCSTSTLQNKVIVFNPYSDKTGVFYDESNGCIELLAQDPKRMIDLSDKFIYDLISVK